MVEFKIVHDPVHGSMRVDGVFLKLLNTLEIARLRGIKQLGLAFLVFPGANHTRLEHSLGTSYIAKEICKSLRMDEVDTTIISVSAMLHDLGHGPFSHVVEHVVYETTGMDHMDITIKIIKGEYDPITKDTRELLSHVPRVCDVLEKHGLDPKMVADLVVERGAEIIRVDEKLPVQEGQAYFISDRNYMKQIIHGTVDADQIDFLLRDAYYTGVAHGIIDLPRILKTIVLHHNDIVIDKSGVPAIEGLLVARTLMYTSVYYHKTTRIAEQMLARAIESVKDRLHGLERMNDAELITALYKGGGFGKEMIVRIMYRQLYKKAFMMFADEVNDDNREVLMELSEYGPRLEMERELAEKLHIPEGRIIIDVPSRSVILSEPRLKKTDFKVLDGSGGISTLNRYSPIARALQLRKVPDWAMIVSADPKYIDIVRNKATRYIFS